MKTVDEFVDGLEPGELFTLKDVVIKSGASSVTDTVALCEEFYNYYHSPKRCNVKQWSDSCYQKNITMDDPFIKKFRTEAKNVRSAKALLGIWLNNVPYSTWFSAYLLSLIFGKNISKELCEKHLSDAVRDGLLLSKDFDGNKFYKKSPLLDNINPKYNDIQTLFARFLAKKGLTGRYAEVIGDRSIDDILTGVDELHPVLPIKWIGGTIDFGSTKEGFGYWNEVHRDWMEEIILYYKPDYESVLKDMRDSLDTIVTKVFYEIAHELLCLNGWYNNNSEGKPKWTVFR